MKTLFIAGSLLLLAVCISCNKTSTNNNNLNNPTLDGTWKVSLFIESGNASTTDFDGYTFNFVSTGVLTATKSGTTKNGTWSQAAVNFNIDLGAKGDANKPLGELTNNWQIISFTSNELRLTDNGTGNEEMVTFVKN